MIVGIALVALSIVELCRLTYPSWKNWQDCRHGVGSHLRPGRCLNEAEQFTSNKQRTQSRAGWDIMPLMIETDHVVVPTDARGHPICQRCQKSMWLLRIVPDEPGYEMRKFECSNCARAEQLKTHSP